MKSEVTIWENVIANDILDKGLISKIHTELKQFKTRKTNNPINKWTKDLNGYFSKEGIQRVQRHERKLSITSHQRDVN